MKTGWIEALRILFFGNKSADLHPSIAEIQPKLACSLLIQSVDYSQRLQFANDWIGKRIYGQYLWLDKLGLLDWQVLVTKKRTQQLINLTALWRQVILENRNHQVVKQIEVQQPSTLDWWAICRETREPIKVFGYIE